MSENYPNDINSDINPDINPETTTETNREKRHAEARAAFIEGNERGKTPTLYELSEKYDIPIETLREMSIAEKWNDQRAEFWTEVWRQYMSKHTVKKEESIVKWKNSHDEYGHFKKGNPGGPGRGNGYHTITTLRKRIYALWERSSDAFEAAMIQLLDKAANGDMDSIKFLIPYIIGKPDQNVNIQLEGVLSDDDNDFTGVPDDELKKAIAYLASLRGNGNGGGNGRDRKSKTIDLIKVDDEFVDKNSVDDVIIDEELK